MVAWVLLGGYQSVLVNIMRL